jgi:hypothetical protein
MPTKERARSTPAVRNNDSVRGEIVEPLAGQDDDISGFAIAQAVQQP